MKILLSGSNGFLGTALSKKLIASPIPRHLLNVQENLKDYLDQSNPEIIIHCSAYGNMNNQTDIGEMANANIKNTINLLEVLKTRKLELVILMGSSSEYGIRIDGMSESDSCKPNTPYGITKLAMTQLGQYYHRAYSLPIVIVRPFSVYGPGEAPFRFIPVISKKIKKNAKVEVCSGNHDWIFIDDFVRGIEKIIEKRNVLKGKIVNIGTGIETDNVDIVKRLYRMVEKDENYKEIERMRPSDSFKWVSDNRLLKSLGWKQETPLDEGLLKTYEYYQRH